MLILTRTYNAKIRFLVITSGIITQASALPLELGTIDPKDSTDRSLLFWRLN